MNIKSVNESERRKMGFSEDDRIRSKNRVHNDAYELYQDLIAFKYSHQNIIDYANFALVNCTDSYRSEVLNTMISIVRSSNAQGNLI